MNSDVEDDNDVFGVLEEDNESYLTEMQISSLSAVRSNLSEVNSTRRRKSEGKSVSDASLISRRSYNTNRRNLLKTLTADQLSDSGNNFSNLYTQIESRHCPYKNEVQSAENFASKHEAATVIQKYWRRYVLRRIFRRVRDMLIKYSRFNSSALLRPVNPREADLMDRASGTFIRFRLGGETFPPVIVYKIFTNRPVVDLCKNNYPFDVYNDSGDNCATNFFRTKTPAGEINNFAGKFVGGKEDLKNFDDRVRYERMDGNDWRPFLGSLAEKPEISNAATANKDAISTRVIRKRRLKLKLIERLYENGRRKEREREMETERRN